MPNRIVLKKGTTAGAAPSASDLVPGELAVNSADGGLFTKLENATVHVLIPRANEAWAVSRGGTGATDAATARTNLGMAIGTHVQAWDPDLDAIGALAGTAGLLRKTGTNAWALDSNTYLTANQTITLSGDVTGSGTTAITASISSGTVTSKTLAGLTTENGVVINASDTILQAFAKLQTQITNVQAGAVSAGGSNGQIQYNSSGQFAGDAGLSYQLSTKSLTVGGATVTTSAPVVNASQTWNAAGVSFTGLLLNITDTASAAASLLVNLQVSGATVFSVRKDAFTRFGGTTSAFPALKRDGTGLRVRLADDSADAPLTASAVTATTFTGALVGNASTANALTSARSFTLTGDVTGTVSSDLTSGASIATSLGVSGVVAGTYNNNGTQVRPFTVDAKGRITEVGVAVTITPSWSSITSKPTTISGFGITDAQPLDGDLTAIAALTGTTGILRKTAEDTWSLDTAVYLTGNQTITLSGDATGSGTTAVTVTLANSGATAGTYGGNNSIPALTIDAKGRITAASAVVPSGTWAISVSGNAATATVLATARLINGVSFDGSSNVTVPAAANTLTGATLASGVTASSLTSVGTLTSLAVAGSISQGGVATDSTAVLTTSTTATDQVVMTHDVTLVRGVKYVLQVVSGVEYQISEVLVIHDGSTANITEYAVIRTGNVLATFTADVSTGNLRLLVSPTNAVSTIKAASTAIAA